MRLFIGIFVIFVGLFFCCNVRAEEVVVPEEYKVWLENLKKEMIDRGISKKTIKKAYAKNYYRYRPEVIELDRKQPEFVLTSTDYLNKLVNKKRVDLARQKYKELYPLFKDMEDKYGVPISYLIAFWGLESNFGASFGNFEIIDALTTLSYDDRRSKFFKDELYNALKIMEKYDIKPEDMQGSWAGAMGHFQFMPSTFTNYAVDYDKDGYIDIWHTFEDAIASAANYLSKLGWKKDEPWGLEVSLSYKFDYSNTGINQTKTVAEWKKLGVRTAEGKDIKLDENLKGSVIIPEGRKGKAYLVFGNFKKIMIWNRSESYALAISKLSDYILSDKKWEEESKNPAVSLKTEDILAIQKFINALGWGKLDEDGKFGSKTREAVKDLQKKARMPQDGYPDYQLLNKINKYNPDTGFVIPVQPQKTKK